MVWSCKPPPVRTRPFIVEDAVVVLRRVVLIPPANVEVAVEVEVTLPTVSCPTDDEEKKESMNRPMFAKKEVEVAFVAVALTAVMFWKVEATVVEVAYIAATVGVEVATS